MIDSNIKDLIIDWLCNQFGISCQFHPKIIADTFKVDYKMTSLFLKQLSEMNLIDYSERGAGTVYCSPKMDFYDFKLHGGFVAKEKLFADNLQKLQLEIEQLKRQFPQKVDTLANIGSIVQSICAALPFFYK